MKHRGILTLFLIGSLAFASAAEAGWGFRSMPGFDRPGETTGIERPGSLYRPAARRHPGSARRRWASSALALCLMTGASHVAATPRVIYQPCNPADFVSSVEQMTNAAHEKGVSIGAVKVKVKKGRPHLKIQLTQPTRFGIGYTVDFVIPLVSVPDGETLRQIDRLLQGAAPDDPSRAAMHKVSTMVRTAPRNGKTFIEVPDGLQDLARSLDIPATCSSRR